MHFEDILVVGLLPQLIAADVKFTSPTGGAAYEGGEALTITWEDSGDAPALIDLSKYGLNLCAGGNADGSFDCTLANLIADGSFDTAGSVSPVIPKSAGGSVLNAYFLQIVSTSTTGEQVANYSPRFSLNSMTGKFSAKVKNGIAAVGSSTHGPGSVDEQLLGRAGDDSPYDIPYDEQSGPTRYAPMQPRPGSKITAQTASPQFPTSSVVIAQSNLPPPLAQTTLTQPQTYSTISHANMAPAAAQPMDDMQKYLNRWKDKE